MASFDISGVWQAGEPASEDESGNLYVATGNGHLIPTLAATGFRSPGIMETLSLG
jgi:hypothetical protein